MVLRPAARRRAAAGCAGRRDGRRDRQGGRRAGRGGAPGTHARRPARRHRGRRAHRWRRRRSSPSASRSGGRCSRCWRRPHRTSPTAVEALGTASVEWKLDGLRVQVHRDGDRVAVFTRNLNDITARVPEIVRVATELPVDRVVLDGEAIAVASDGRPRMFQETVAWRDRRTVTEAPAAVDDPALTPLDGSTAMSDGEAAADPDVAGLAVDPAGLRPFFFDCLHLDGRDLVDEPLGERLAALDVAAGPWRIPGEVTADPAAGQAVLDASLAAGHEGVVVKAIESAYQAGRRGKTWQKVKPVHTLDLVVLAAEWGHGRRTGWLSNLHLGARDPDHGDFVMVGKTFKGLTDELLRWQTERFQQLEERTEGHIVWVRPEQVVEIALDGVQVEHPLPRQGRPPLRPRRPLPPRQDAGRGRHHPGRPGDAAGLRIFPTRERATRANRSDFVGTEQGLERVGPRSTTDRWRWPDGASGAVRRLRRDRRVGRAGGGPAIARVRPGARPGDGDRHQPRGGEHPQGAVARPVAGDLPIRPGQRPRRCGGRGRGRRRGLQPRRRGVRLDRRARPPRPSTW